MLSIALERRKARQSSNDTFKMEIWWCDELIVMQEAKISGEFAPRHQHLYALQYCSFMKGVGGLWKLPALSMYQHTIFLLLTYVNLNVDSLSKLALFQRVREFHNLSLNIISAE